MKEALKENTLTTLCERDNDPLGREEALDHLAAVLRRGIFSDMTKAVSILQCYCVLRVNTLG